MRNGQRLFELLNDELMSKFCPNQQFIGYI